MIFPTQFCGKLQFSVAQICDVTAEVLVGMTDGVLEMQILQ